MTRTQIDTYHHARSLVDAWQLVASGDPRVRLLSGGTDLAIACPDEVRTLVDLGGVVDATIEVDAGGSLDIGAMATLTQLAEHPDLAGRASGVVPTMLDEVGSPLLRNVCTIGGHLARGKLSDVIPVLLALDAEVTVFTGRPVRFPLAEYYESGHHGRPHILTAVHLADLGRASAAFAKFSRTAYDFPLVNACCRVDASGETVSNVRIVAGATPQRGARAYQAEMIVRDAGLSEAAIVAAATAARDEVPTRSSWVASAEYRSHLVGVLVERTLSRIASMTEMP